MLEVITGGVYGTIMITLLFTEIMVGLHSICTQNDELKNYLGKLHYTLIHLTRSMLIIRIFGLLCQYFAIS